MAKIQKQSIRKIDISQINLTENVRKEYTEIENLARSIERDGQLQPIGVIEKEDGTFDMLYGFRRLNAFKFLCSENKDFNQIEAKIVSGDSEIIQIVENVQREDLTPKEFEMGIRKLLERGMSQKEVSERLNIRQTKVSDALAASNTREKAEDLGINTDDFSTSTMSVLRNVPDKDLKEVVEKVKQKGPTVKAAKEELEKKKHGDDVYTQMTIAEFLKLPYIADFVKREKIKLIK